MVKEIRDLRRKLGTMDTGQLLLVLQNLKETEAQVLKILNATKGEFFVKDLDGVLVPWSEIRPQQQ